MKFLFYIGAIGIIIFEIANVYFIMPMPGSQEMNSIGFAYFLYSARWVFRFIFGFFAIVGFIPSFKSSIWITVVLDALAIITICVTNFMMSADSMFKEPTTIDLKNVKQNKIDDQKLIIGITYKDEARAYPIQFLGYHHQVVDTLDDKPVMVTYCTVCRNGRVYEPVIDNKYEKFRLVGMDHFNAMFEDSSTKSWWRQATGEAVAGKLKGRTLPEFPSMQTTLGKWKELYPHTLIMQGDKEFQVEYDSMLTFEGGRLKGKLTRRDTSSWQTKSWVVGVSHDNVDKAYDWNELQKSKVIYDELNSKLIAIILSKDKKSFASIEVDKSEKIELKNDTIIIDNRKYNFMGKSLDSMNTDLKRLNAYQEYWHSWKQFHPNTLK